MRVGKDFRFGGARRFTAAVDIINLLNHDADQQFQTGGNQLYSPNFAIAADGSFLGQTRQPPRSFQISFRFQF